MGSPAIHADGFVLPRLETPPSGVAGSLGGEAADWIDASGVLGVGNALRPWQRYVLDRALEVREDGRLRWPTVIVTVSRQSGKSWLLRGVAWWRMHQAERFGEAQTVLHVSNKAAQADEVWKPAARLASEVYGLGQGLKPDGQARVLAQMGQQSLSIPDGSRWLVAAATQNAGVGFSVSMALVDEAWAIPAPVVNSAIKPTMAARAQPQLWLISTAGDSRSDLLRAYRDAAIRDTGGAGSVLLLEWSAPPDAPYDDVRAWRWASPQWDELREEFLRDTMQVVPEASFRQEFLNAWVIAADGWMRASQWRACGRKVLAAPRRKDAPVVAVGTDPKDGRVLAVVAWRKGGKVAVVSWQEQSPDAMWRRVAALGPVRVLLPDTLAVHYPGDPRAVGLVSSATLRKYVPAVGRLVAERGLTFRESDEALTTQVLTAVAVGNGDGALTLDARRSPGPITLARCMVWAVGEVLRPASPRPVVVTA